MEAVTAGGAPGVIAPPQHMVALKRANEVRFGHCDLKRDILAGRVNVIAALTDPRAAGSLTVADLLCAQRRWGRTRARKFLQRVEVSESRRVDALTSRQRRLISKGFSSA